MTNSYRLPKFRNILMGVVAGITLALLAWFLIVGLEGETPTFVLDLDQDVIGASSTLKGFISDGKSGLKRVWMAVIQEGKEFTVLDHSFPSQSVIIREGPKQHRLSVDIQPKQMGLKDGSAILRISVWDHSLKGWGKGNQFYEERTIRFDTVKPTIEMGTRTHNLNRGGAGVAVFKTSEKVATAGIQVGDRFFPALSGAFESPNAYVGYFGLPRDGKPGTRIYATATDVAGNTGTTTFYYYINEKTFKKDTMHVSDRFLDHKLPNFSNSVDWGDTPVSNIDKFLLVNRGLREKNYLEIREICSQSDGKQHWSGRFSRLPASAKKAGFGEHRTYVYQDKPVDEQIHQGIDLAATSNASVPASNHGRVAFAGDLGIYGQTIIIDHGFFLFTMYSHLSGASVSKGDMVSKGDNIGLTGSTGMAGGDHLHFGVLIAHTFVNPLEWWDRNWIKNNVTDKMQSARKKMGRGKKEAAQ